MSDLLKPRDGKDVEAAVQWALAESKALEVVGGGSKRAVGRPSQTDLTLDLSGLSGVTLYEPDELVLSAKAATPLAEIETMIAAQGQELAFEPMDYGAVLGGPTGAATIGGVLATNLSGPRRIKVGAARDHFLGVTAVSGRGDTFKSGGRVVKNVTGYDLCKVLAGSWGTLAAMTDVTVKILPKAETEETLLILGLETVQAGAAMTAAMGSTGDVSGAAHLPSAAAARLPLAARDGRSVTALRLEGFAPSVGHRRRVLEQVAKGFGPLAVLAEVESRMLWRAIRDVIPFAAARERVVWRISTVAARGTDVGTAIEAALDAELIYDWAGGLIWLAAAASDDAGARFVREALASVGGHATLVRAPAALRAALGAFEPQEQNLAALSKRVKESFDPRGVLNPGRMYAGI
jgi:glycolate dehydrogenase FAD-binding subunit